MHLQRKFTFSIVMFTGKVVFTCFLIRRLIVLLFVRVRSCFMVTKQMYVLAVFSFKVFCSIELI